MLTEDQVECLYGRFLRSARPASQRYPTRDFRRLYENAHSYPYHHNLLPADWILYWLGSGKHENGIRL